MHNILKYRKDGQPVVVIRAKSIVVCFSGVSDLSGHSNFLSVLIDS